MSTQVQDRRAWLKLVTAASSGVLLVGCGGGKAQSDEKKPGAGKTGEVEVAPTEDLMQEHGLLNRVLLVYDECVRRLEGKTDKNPLGLLSTYKDGDLKPELLTQAAGIIRHFIEDYHEKQEEEDIFPRLEKAGKLTDLVAILRGQHQAGRGVTEQILGLANLGAMKRAGDRQKLIAALRAFNRMYRPHEAREDTILFPEFRKIIKPSEYDALGDKFEAREHEMFGEDGFEKNVAAVGEIEKELGIYELSQFTPKA
jgi:hemerythrin-like domain-containing protein